MLVIGGREGGHPSEQADRPTAATGEEKPTPGDQDLVAWGRGVGQKHVHKTDENHSRRRLLGARSARVSGHHLSQYPQEYEDSRGGAPEATDPASEPQERGQRSDGVELSSRRRADRRRVSPLRRSAECAVEGRRDQGHREEK